MNKTTSHLLACSALLLLFLSPCQAASPWSTHIRATYVKTADKSDAFTALGINFRPDAISTNDKFIPEIDVNYAFSDVFSAQLVLTIPQKLDVSLAGVGKLGSFNYLPPTFLFEYRANPGGTIRPYVGAGINGTLIWNDALSVAGVPLHLDTSSVGFAAQIGIDCKIDERWAFNVDVKYAGINSQVYAGSTALTQARLDPILYSVGVRYEF